MLKEKLDHAADMIIQYEASQKEKNEELLLLKASPKPQSKN